MRQVRQGAARLGPAHPTRMRTSGGQVRRLMLRSNDPEPEGPLLFNALVRHGVNDIFAVQHTLGTEGVLPSISTARTKSVPVHDWFQEAST